MPTRPFTYLRLTEIHLRANTENNEPIPQLAAEPVAATPPGHQKAREMPPNATTIIDRLVGRRNQHNENVQKGDEDKSTSNERTRKNYECPVFMRRTLVQRPCTRRQQALLTDFPRTTTTSSPTDDVKPARITDIKPFISRPELTEIQFTFFSHLEFLISFPIGRLMQSLNIYPMTTTPTSKNKKSTLQIRKRRQFNGADTSIQVQSPIQPSPSNVRKFKCRMCVDESIFIGEPALARHFAHAHTHDKPFVCSVCTREFTRDEHRKRHQLMTHRFSRIDDDVKCERVDMDIKPAVRSTCRLCGDTVAHQMLIAHFRERHVDDKPFACSQCSRTFRRFERCINHERVHHNRERTVDKEYVCEKCQYLFRNSWRRNAHMRSCTGAQPRPTARTRTCRVCAKSIVGQLALLIHFKMAHMDARPFECRVLCARQFWTVHSRTNHERTCHGRTGADQSPAIGSACRLCDEKCASMEELRRHFVDSHNDQRPFICTKCKRKCGTHSETHHNFVKDPFRTDQRLSAHMPRCTGAPPTPSGRVRTCRLCDMECVGEPSLIAHFKREHDDSRPYMCAKCGAQYWNDTLRVREHMNKCRGQVAVMGSFEPKPAMCRLCAMACASRGALRRHFEDKHFNERPFACNATSDIGICGRSFNDSHVRDVHERKCPGYRLVRIVSCRVCQLDFATDDLLRAHFEHSHGSRYPFMCVKCKYAYRYLKRYKQHVVKCTGVPPRTSLAQQMFTCRECEYPCAGHAKLVQHFQLSHVGRKPFVCTHVQRCGRQFWKDKTRGRHERMCTGERNLNEKTLQKTCRLCDEKFANEHQLIEHFNASHAAAKAYACTKCGRQFGWSSGKYAHERLCIGVDAPRRRPGLPNASINCRLCAHACDDRIDLRLHFRAAHAADERGIACANACGASFWELRKARAHEQKCTGRPSPRRCSIGGIDLKCADCGRADFTLTAGVGIGLAHYFFSSMSFHP